MLSQGVQNDQDRMKIEKLSSIMSRISSSFVYLAGACDSFDAIADLHDQLSNAGVHETILDILEQYSQSFKKQSDQ